MRTFVALELPEEARRAAAAVVEGLALADFKPVAAENIHLTLRFLGETGDAAARAVAASLARIAARHRPFTIELRGGGAFPSGRSPRVVWIGVEPVPAELVELQREVEEAVQSLGFEPEARGFSPHVTIGRFRGRGSRPASLASELARLKERADKYHYTVKVESMTFFRSTLTPGGPVYTALGRFVLGERGAS